MVFINNLTIITNGLYCFCCRLKGNKVTPNIRGRYITNHGIGFTQFGCYDNAISPITGLDLLSLVAMTTLYHQSRDWIFSVWLL